jgi:hypothetical protein
MKNGWTLIWKINGKDEWMLMNDDGGLDSNCGWNIDEKLGSRLYFHHSRFKIIH